MPNEAEYLEFKLEKVQDGAIGFLWDRALREALENILDENTDPEAVRTITIKAILHPSAARNTAAVGITVSNKLVGTDPVPAGIVFGKDARGRLVCKDQQTDLFNDKPAPQPTLLTTEKVGG